MINVDCLNDLETLYSQQTFGVGLRHNKTNANKTALKMDKL